MSVITKQRLASKQFKDNDKLQRCLVSAPDHVVPGSRGDHVGLIQQALIKLGQAVINAGEISTQFYGSSTERAVLRYKGPPRNIINTAYQHTPDNIVGQMTIDRLDDDMVKLEKVPVSLLVSVTEDGAPHDHKTCPRLQAGQHERTPINPLRFGRMINIFGDHETDYLGFKDFSTRADFIVSESGEVRPLTFERPERGGLIDKCASDICMRSIPVTDETFTKQTGKPNTVAEIKRIAMPGCRITFAGEESEAGKLFSVGPLIERVVIKEPIVIFDKVIGERTKLAFVFTFLG